MSWEDSAFVEVDYVDLPPKLENCADETSAYRLRNLMTDLSEDHYCAGWLIGLEYMLFGAAYADDEFGSGLTFSEKRDLILYSQDCQGWWIWKHQKRTFVPFDEWLEMYEDHCRERMH